MRRFILAPDSFKGTMTAREICDIFADAVKALVPEAETVKIPMSDGGEGMVEACLKLLGGEKRFAQVTGPRGSLVCCPYGILPDGTAVMEMAGCAGLPLMEGCLDPLHATTRGLGELLTLLAASGCRRVLMGIGGSATNDCGLGMAAALGYRFTDGHGAEVEPYACNMGRIRHILPPEKLPELSSTVACDVDNPLCGERGASAVFGPQKVLKPEQIGPLDESIRAFAGLIRTELGPDVLEIPGAGAAGGLGAAMLAFCGAELKPGIELLLDAADMDGLLKDAELVITGEGRIDGQSAAGKVPVGVGRRAIRAAVLCGAACGWNGPGAEAVLGQGVTAYDAAGDGTKSMEELKKTCREDLRRAALQALEKELEQGQTKRQ